MAKKNGKSILEFNEVQEALEFLKTNDNIKIKVSLRNEWDGFYQLVGDDEEKAGRTLEEIKNMVEATGYSWYEDSPDEDYNLNKPVYESRAGIKHWANGYTSKSTIIKMLKEFDGKEYDYFEWDSLNDHLIGNITSDPDKWMEYFEAYDVKSGVTTRKNKEISWWASTYKEDEDWDIVFIT